MRLRRMSGLHPRWVPLPGAAVLFLISYVVDGVRPLQLSFVSTVCCPSVSRALVRWLSSDAIHRGAGASRDASMCARGPFFLQAIRGLARPLGR
eukprot:5736352-Pyramimonas_sp.AAC.1